MKWVRCGNGPPRADSHDDCRRSETARELTRDAILSTPGNAHATKLDRTEGVWHPACPSPSQRKGDRKMQRANLDLKNFVPVWEREIADSVTETEFDRLLRSDVKLREASGTERFVGDGRALAQDVFGALIVRQRRV